MNPILGFALSEYHIIILVLLALVLFGGRKLPELGRSLGKGIVEFKKGLKGMEDEVEGGPSVSAGQVSAPQQRQEPALEQPRPPQRITAPAPKFEDTAPKFEDKPAVAPPSQPQS